MTGAFRLLRVGEISTVRGFQRHLPPPGGGLPFWKVAVALKWPMVLFLSPQLAGPVGAR